MKTNSIFLIIGLLMIHTLSGQIKIGDNPQNIDPASVLELESPSRVLVITRVTDVQMNNISPLRGALVYNTDQQCLHYYDGSRWINICEELDDSFTVSTNAVFNPFSRDSTVVVTQTDDNYNFEVNKITGDNIVDTSINGSLEIQQETITRELLAPRSVSLGKLADGVNPGDLIKWNGSQWILDNEETIDITEKDSIVGNEILDARPGGSLERFGAGLEGDPFTVDVLDGGIGNEELAADAVTTDKILNGTIINEDLADDAVTSTKILDGEVNTVDIADDAITSPKILDGEVNTVDIADNAITSIKILDGEVSTDDIADDAITSPKILDGEVNTVDIADNAITSTKIQDGQVDTQDIATDAITNVKMGDGSVGAAEIIDRSITRIKLEDGINLGDLLWWDGTNWVLTNESALNITEGDGDPLNEIQDLDFTGGQITLSGDPTPTTIDLSAYDSNAADDFDGAWSSLTGVPAGFADGTDDVDDADNNPANEIQDLDFTGNQITLSGDPTPTTIDLSAYDSNAADDFDGAWGSLTGVPAGFADGTDDVDDADNNPANEIQDLDFTGNQITLSGDPTPTTIDLSAYDSNAADDFDGAWGSLTGVPAGFVDGTDDVDDADNNPANEIQDLDFTGNQITLSGDPTPTTIDLSAYDSNAADDFDGAWGSLTGVPAGFVDGTDDDTTLATNNLTQTAATDRTYNLSGGTLSFNGTGSVGIGTVTPPTSTLETGGSFAAPIVTTGANIALDVSNYTVILGGNHSVTLPAAASCQGRIYIIKNTTAFNPSISSFIDNTGANITAIPSGVIHLQSDGSNWQQIN